MAIKITKALKKPKGKMYECQVFFPTDFPKKWKYVTDLASFTQFLSKSHSTWKYFNVYEKGTKNYLKRFYPNTAVPKTLALLLLFGLGVLTQKFTPSNTFTSCTLATFNPLGNTSSATTSNNDFNFCATIPTPLIDKEAVCI